MCADSTTTSTTTSVQPDAQHTMMLMMKQIMDNVSAMQSSFNSMEQIMAALQTDVGSLQQRLEADNVDDVSDAEPPNNKPTAAASSAVSQRMTRARAARANADDATDPKKTRHD